MDIGEGLIAESQSSVITALWYFKACDLGDFIEVRAFKGCGVSSGLYRRDSYFLSWSGHATAKYGKAVYFESLPPLKN